MKRWSKFFSILLLVIILFGSIFFTKTYGVTKTNVLLERKIYSFLSNGLAKQFLETKIDEILTEEISTFSGSGTYNDPYMIYSSDDLQLLRNDLDGYYKLANDIVLDVEWVPVGTEESPFSGFLDGNGYSISQLTISGDYSDCGLFGYVGGTNSTDYFGIHNLTLIEPMIYGTGDVGALIGHLNLSNDKEYSLKNIYVVGGEINSSLGNAGAFVGNISTAENSLDITLNGVFSSADVYGYNSAGLVGNVGINSSIILSNFQNVGLIMANGNSTERYSTVIGNVDKNDNSYVQLDNFVVTSMIRFNNKINTKLLNFSFSDNSKFKFYNGFYVKKTSDTIDFNYATADGKVSSVLSADMLTDSSIYSSYSNFDDSWEIKTVNGIKRIPVLKGVDFEYTSISDIEVMQGNSVSLLSYITPYTEAFRLDYDVVNNEDMIRIDEVMMNDNSYISDISVIGVKKGNTTLKVTSNYDGFVGDVPVTVIDNPDYNYVMFDANGGSGSMDVMSISVNDSCNLSVNKFTNGDYVFDGWNTKADGSGVTYTDGQEITLTDDIVLYAQWVIIEDDIIELPDILEFNSSVEVDNNTKILRFNNTNLSVNNTLSLINTNGTVKFFNKSGSEIGDTELVTTASSISIVFPQNSKIYKIVVTGDVNGDGILSVFDIVKINNHLIDESKSLDGTYKLAGDVNSDDNLSILDIVKINNAIVAEN